MNFPQTVPAPASGSFPCRECSAGMMHLRHITYFTWLGEELIMVPNFPAWICDMCGKREFDERAISLMAMILDPNAGKPTRRRQRPARPGSAKRNLPHLPLD